MRSVTGGVLACLVALTVAGCSQTTSGTPQASSGANSSTATTKSPGTATSGSAKPSLADLDPCTLLSAADVARIGTAAGQRDGKSCRFKASGKFGVEITLVPNGGIADLNTANSEASPIKVGARQGVKVLDKGNAVCAIGIAVTDKSSVLVIGSSVTAVSAEAGCPYANDVATIIEPKLP